MKKQTDDVGVGFYVTKAELLGMLYSLAGNYFYALAADPLTDEVTRLDADTLEPLTSQQVTERVNRYYRGKPR